MPTKKPSPPAAKKAIQTVRGEAVKIREADRKRAESLLGLIARRRERIAEDFFEIGRALRELLQKKLYVALGFGSFEAMLTERDVMSLAQAKKLIQVVSHVPIEKALALGPEKAYALTRYAAATPELDTAASLLDAGTKVGGKRADEASLRDIERATREERKKSAPKPVLTPEQEAAAKVAWDLLAWLRKQKVRGAAVVAKREKGAYRLFVELPLEGAAVLLALPTS